MANDASDEDVCKATSELDAKLSELQFDIFFIKCQLIFDSPLQDLDALSDVNEELSSMELKASRIEAELKKRNDNPCARNPYSNLNNLQLIQSQFQSLIGRSGDR